MTAVISSQRSQTKTPAVPATYVGLKGSSSHARIWFVEGFGCGIGGPMVAVSRIGPPITIAWVPGHCDDGRGCP